MTASHRDGPDEEDRETGAPAPARRNLWRLGTPVAVLLCGGLFAVSATNSDGTDLRPGRYTDLADLVGSQADEVQSLQGEAATLADEVATLTDDVDDAAVRRIRRDAAALRGPAGLEPSTGPGVTVVLSDAPDDLLDEASEDPGADVNQLLVHQQDIQAVVNAMWAGGAEAVTIEGQRIISTTGIKCRGSVVQLQGLPYPQPYTIQAVGDPTALATALDADLDVTRFRADADNPAVDVGWEFEPESSVTAPAYEGVLDITQATPTRP